MKALLKFIVLVLVNLSVLGQGTGANTTRARMLLDEGRRCLNKQGTEKLDLDSALNFASKASTLSHHLAYTYGAQNAALIIAETYDKGENWSKAWGLYSRLNDTSRISFLSTMILYRILREQGKPSFTDSAGRCVSLLEPMIKTVRTTYGNWRSHAALVNYYAQKRNKRQAAYLAVEGFQFLRQSKDIFSENEYVAWISPSLIVDSTLFPAMTSILHQVIKDDSMLFQISETQQRAALRALVTTAVNYQLARQIGVAMYIDSIAIRLNERLHQNETRPYNDLSFLYTLQGKDAEALSSALDAIRISQTASGRLDAIGYEAASRTYSISGRFDKCLEYFYKALPIMIENPAAVNNVGAEFVRGVHALLQQHNPTEALRVIRIIKNANHSFQLDQMGRAYTTMSLASCFFALGQTDSAERYYTEAIGLVRELDGVRKIIVYNNAAAFYTAIGEYNKAKPFLDTLSSDNLHPLIAPSELEKVWHLRYQADSALHNYQGALSNLGKYQVLHDSLVNVEKNKRMAELDIKYETEKKNLHIAYLENQSILQKRLQRATFRKDLITRNSLIAVATLLALLTASLYNRWRARRRMSLHLGKLSVAQQQLLVEKEGLLSEKEWLLCEIHHRVKNNLQIIIGLLNLQAGQLRDEIAISAFQEIGARVNAISLVHKKLYQETKDMASINMSQYIHELVSFLRYSLGSGKEIAFELNIQEIVLDVTQCVPLGLILNEAITNAIKYAFIGSRILSPVIRISLALNSGHDVTLVVSDNGNGLPSGFDPRTSDSIGFELIHNFNLQLEGTLDIQSQNGLTLILTFPWYDLRRH
jgi:two-component sensor histidine kinase